jgi:hypothetical protein
MFRPKTLGVLVNPNGNTSLQRLLVILECSRVDAARAVLGRNDVHDAKEKLVESATPSCGSRRW